MMNWRGRPLTSHEVILNTMPPPHPDRPDRPRRTRPERIPARSQDPQPQMKALETDGTLTRHDFHGEWNCTLNPTAARVENAGRRHRAGAGHGPPGRRIIRLS